MSPHRTFERGDGIRRGKRIASYCDDYVVLSKESGRKPDLRRCDDKFIIYDEGFKTESQDVFNHVSEA